MVDEGDRLSDETQSQLARLWSYPKATRYLARLLLAVYCGSDDERGRYVKQLPWKHINQEIQAFGGTTEPLNISNFAYRHTDRFTDPRLLNAIAAYLADLFEKDESRRTLRSVIELLEECNIISLYKHIVGKETVPADQCLLLWQQIDHHKNPSICRALQVIFNVQAERIEETSRALLRRSGEKYTDSGFICYRYATTPGYIVKSFLKIRPPTNTVPLCNFEHDYIDRDKMRRKTSGYLIPLRHAIYFIGDIDRGAAIKVIALRPPGIHRRFQGLVLSMNSLREPLVCRLVLKKCSYTTAEDSQIAVFREEELEKHIRLEVEPTDPTDVREEARYLREHLRNDIASELIEPVFDDRDQPVDQWRIISIIDNALRVNEERPLLKIKRENDSRPRPYNPLANDARPINAAMTLTR